MSQGDSQDPLSDPEGPLASLNSPVLSPDQRATSSARSGRPRRRPTGSGLSALVVVLTVAVVALGAYALSETLTYERNWRPELAAIEQWERRIEAGPGNPEVLVGLGYAYQEAGRYEDALTAYDDALELDTENLAALYNRGVVLLELGRDEEAEAGLAAVLEIAPDHVLAAKTLGEHYIAQHDFEAALRVVQPAVAERPQYADLQYLAGYACEGLGRTAEALAYYKSALTYAPDLEEARLALARLGEAVGP